MHARSSTKRKNIYAKTKSYIEHVLKSHFIKSQAIFPVPLINYLTWATSDVRGKKIHSNNTHLELAHNPPSGTSSYADINSESEFPIAPPDDCFKRKSPSFPRNLESTTWINSKVANQTIISLIFHLSPIRTKLSKHKLPSK